MYFNENSTLDFVENIDAFKLFSLNEDVPQLSTRDAANNILIINVFTEPTGKSQTIIPMDFTSNFNGTYTITVDNFTIADNITIQLRDKVTNSTINIDETSSYNFEHSTYQENDRFELIFTNLVSIDENNTNEAIEIYSNKNVVYVLLREEENAVVDIYNKLGERVLSQQISGIGLHKISVNNIYDNLVVSVKTNTEFKTETVMIINK